jgi:hypothetical protein
MLTAAADLININRCRSQPCHGMRDGGWQRVQERSMKAGWRIFLLFAVVFIAALGAEQMFVPDIVPVAFAEEPRSLWSLQIAFVLRTVELIAAGVAMIAFAIPFGAWAKSWPRRRAL